MSPTNGVCAARIVSPDSYTVQEESGTFETWGCNPLTPPAGSAPDLTMMNQLKQLFISSPAIPSAEKITYSITQARRKLLKVDRAPIAREALVLGGSGACPPRKFWDFRLSEVVSDALFKRQKRPPMLNQKEL